MLCDHKEDFELCNNTWRRIIKKYGDNAAATDFLDHERIVVLVWTVSGIIENGGFRSLFGSSLPGDPHYILTLEAFRKIGCSDVVEVLKKALCLFPGCKPPIEDRLRLKLYDDKLKKIQKEIDTKFWSSLANITRCLAEYIRAVRVSGLPVRKP